MAQLRHDLAGVNSESEPLWFGLTAEQALRELSSNAVRGLATDEVLLRRQRFGWNEFAEEPPVPLWKRALRQLREIVNWILLLAAVVSGVIGDWIDTTTIVAIVVLNVMMTLFQEEKTSHALAMLRKLAAPTVKVIRGGTLQSIPARDLVPGDRLELEAGDHVAADARLLKSYGLRMQEAALTGESMPVKKLADCVLVVGTQLGDRQNMVFMGTTVAAGKGSAVVTATGMSTELGRIAGLIERFVPEPTPLERQMELVGKALISVCLAIVAVIFALQMLRGGKILEVLLISISLAVAAVPEGMPAVVTLTLAIGVQRMARRNALVRKLPSVETLGAATVICADKTGTLTCNEMTVREVHAGRKHFHITGAGYSPRGEFFEVADDETRSSRRDLGHRLLEPQNDPDLIEALVIGARCNNASVTPGPDIEDDWVVTGDPTEGALLVAAIKAGIDVAEHKQHVLFEIPFDSERKMMAMVVKQPEGPATMYVKGAVEIVLAKSIAERAHGKIEKLTMSRRNELLQQATKMASRALRTLAMGYRALSDEQIGVAEEEGLILAGFVGMIDPPRDEAVDSVQKCHDAGILPVMITGDHPATALAIARELEIAQTTAQVLSGEQLESMSDYELSSQVDRIAVYARVSAAHKLRIVKAWQQHQEVVAMTGDGVNDAPALKAADIGIAMGKTGTDVAKEAAGIVLTDDKFSSIVDAVEEGRVIFANIQKFVHYLLACNSGEVLLMSFGAIFGWPVPLTAVQILWINLVTDGLPALALGMEPAERDIMKRKPRSRRHRIIEPGQGVLMLIEGLLIGVIAMLGFWLIYRGKEPNLADARVATFCIVAFSQIFFALSCRSQRDTMPELGLLTNPYLLGAILISSLLQLGAVVVPFAQQAFDARSLPGEQWLLIFGLALTPVSLIEIAKLSKRFWQKIVRT